MNRTVLIVAFHFPPIASSSGMQRALKAVRYLREFGWQPVVLTVTPGAYDNVNPSQLSEIPSDVTVCRAFGLDARRRFSIRGRYPGFLAWPDAWLSWWPSAVFAGARVIRQYKPAAIWSTFPISTANLVAMHLARKSALPWIADLRDPISLDGYPPDPYRFRLARRIERNTVKRSARMVFTAEYTRQIYIDRYPELRDRAVLIPNGYDEANFPPLPDRRETPGVRRTILHSGSLQPRGRHPKSFFRALRLLKDRGEISAANLRVVFRACGAEDQYQALVEELEITDLIELAGHIPYEKAIQEMVEADALLVFQGTNYNHAVPAKLYEYFFAGKPILGIVDKRGETKRVLADVGIDNVASIDDAGEIAHQFLSLIENIGDDSPFLANRDAIAAYSRRNQALKLAEVLEQVIIESGH